MRITIATGPFLPVPPAPTCGGVEMLWHGLAEAFAQKGHSVTFLAKAHPGQPMDETNAGVHYIRLLGCRRSGRLPVDLLKDWFYSCQLLRRLPAADILSLNSFWLPVLAQHLTHNRGRLIVNVHRYPKGQLWLYRGVARIATVSRAMQDAIIAECPAMASITRVFPNPVDTGIFTPPVLARNYNGPQTIVFTGRVHPEKGAHLLVAAFAQLAPQHPQVRLKIIGPSDIRQGGGGKAYLDQLVRLADRFPVEFTGPIDRSVLAQTLQSAHYFCYPSLAEKGEAFGVAPFEAMATGLVPVVSDLSCFRDFIADGKTGIVFNHRSQQSVELLAAALCKAITHPEWMRQWGKEAAAHAAAFSYSRVADDYLADFQMLLREKGYAASLPEGGQTG